MDQISAMRAFVRVVQTGSFTAVAREQQTTQASISKKVAALENKIGVKLLNRSSREHSLTQAGKDYYEKSVLILGEIDEAEASARSELATPKGILRITAPLPFGDLILAPIVKEFIDLYPQIRVEINFSDRHVDLVSEGVDLAIRASQLEDSNLVARKLFDNPLILVASPDYLKQHGRPKHPSELTEHCCVVYSLSKSNNTWHFSKNNEKFSVAVHGALISNNGSYNMSSALLGLGITTLPIWMVKEHLQTGLLEQVLADYQSDNLPFNVVYPQNRYIPLKVRAFVDFLKEKLNQNPLLATH
jgi:DNA-binding transcriptional LysR family regulator